MDEVKIKYFTLQIMMIILFYQQILNVVEGNTVTYMILDDYFNKLHVIVRDLLLFTSSI